MFKNGFFYIIVILFVMSGLGCSSSNDSGEDLDISEIQEIEATGEFSEDEFFSDDGAEGLAEEELVEDVPGLEAELGDEVATLEEDASGDFDLDISDEVASNTEEGADLFDDLDLDENIEEGADAGGKQNVTINADDLDLGDDLGLEDDLDGDSDLASEAGSDELDLDADEDLFRDDDLALDDTAEEYAAVEPVVEDVTIDSDYSDQITEDILAEDVSIDDIDYSAEVLASKTNTGGSRNLVSVKKMQTVPYSKNGVLVNAVYFVRSGDSLRSIGDKVYGSGSGVDFRIVNPHLKTNGLKVGQKVYYNSPTRSQDRSRLLTYYEDARMPAQMYSAQKDENIRTIAEELLGHPRSWMEVWASNQQIESKGGLEAPFQIRYWNGQSTPAPAPVLAKVTPPPTDVPKIENQASLDLGDEVIEEPVEVASIDEQPDMELEAPAEVAVDDFEMDEADLLAEDSSKNVAVNEESFDTAPTPAVQASQETPGVLGEVRDIARNSGAFPTKAALGLDSESMRMGILGLALLMLLIVGFLVVRRRRASNNAVEMDSFDFGGETTVDAAQTKTQIDL